MKNRSLYLTLVLVFVFVFCIQAYAQDQQTAEQSAKVMQQAIMSPKEFIFGTIQFLCMGLIVYFLMVINPQKTAEESHVQFIDNLKKNDDVITSGGLFGKVVSIAPDQIGIEIAPNIKVRFEPKHILPLPKPSTNAK